MKKIHVLLFQIFFRTGILTFLFERRHLQEINLTVELKEWNKTQLFREPDIKEHCVDPIKNK